MNVFTEVLQSSVGAFDKFTEEPRVFGNNEFKEQLCASVNMRFPTR